MKTYLFYLFGFFFFLNVSAAEEPMVLFSKGGEIVCGKKLPHLKSKLGNDYASVEYNFFITAANLSSRVLSVKKSELEVEKERLRVADNPFVSVVKKNDIVLTKDKKPALVEAVFPSGKVLLKPLKIQRNARGSLKIGSSNFIALAGVNSYVAPVNDILAVETDCNDTRSYCRGQSVNDINGLMLCDNSSKAEFEKNKIHCGRQKSAMIDAVFSNGDVLFGSQLMPTAQSSPKQGESNQTPSVHQ